jgi:hypothetical protein
MTFVKCWIAEYTRFNSGFQYSDDDEEAERDESDDPLLRPTTSGDRQLPAISANWRKSWRIIFRVGPSSYKEWSTCAAVSKGSKQKITPHICIRHHFCCLALLLCPACISYWATPFLVLMFNREGWKVLESTINSHLKVSPWHLLFSTLMLKASIFK